MKYQSDCLSTLQAAGISWDDACALRRISMTLHRWHELECGDGDAYSSWCLVRGKLTSTRVKTERGLNVRRDLFEYNDSGAPHMERHYYSATIQGPPVYHRVVDRERGAQKRLAKIMARYPGFQAYVQTDPRGCALYILRPGDVPAGSDVSSCYNRGIAVYK